MLRSDANAASIRSLKVRWSAAAWVAGLTPV